MGRFSIYSIKPESLTPEEQALQNIDQQLAQCGWEIQNVSEMNIMAGLGVAVREFQLTTGEADYGRQCILKHAFEGLLVGNGDAK